MNSLEWINKHYGLQAKKGGRVLYKGRPGEIVGANACYLRIKLDDVGTTANHHPTYELQYLPDQQVTPPCA